MHYDPAIYPEPASFQPERFLAGDDAVPRNAFRPFERGLRSCMGQALAVDEMMIALLMLARWFDFELRDHHPCKPRMSFSDLDLKLGVHAYQGSGFSAGPSGPVMMNVRLAKERK